MQKLTVDSSYDINVVQNVVDYICKEGIYIEEKTTVELMLELEDKIESTQAIADQILSEKFDWNSINVRSSKQLSEFYTYHGYEAYGNPGKSGTNFPTECLNSIIELNDEFAEITQLFVSLIAYRYELTSMESVRKHGNPTEYEGINIVYPDYSQTDTGRIQYIQPNLSNLGPRKRMVVPKPGYKLISFDYKYQEPWIIANMLKLVEVLERMAAGEDYYRVLAQQYADATLSDKDRKSFKTSVIAIGYLCTLNTARRGIPKHLISVIDEFYNKFTNLPEFRAFRDKVKEVYEGDKVMKSYFGTEWEVPYYKGMGYDAWERKAFNRPFQSTGADILFFALESLEKVYTEIDGDVRTYITLHDEVVIHIEERLVTEENINKLRDAILFDIEGWSPMRVDTKILDSWADKD